VFKKGKLVFIENLQQENDVHSGIPYFTARALVVSEEAGEISGSVQTLKASDLISKLSRYRYDGVNSREAHRLYTWPVQLGDNQAWADSKKAFLEQHVMNFPIRILQVVNENELSWEFISPEEFKKPTPGLLASAEYQHYLDQQDAYFFLRKDKNVPK
jgi:hypothetical protein